MWSPAVLVLFISYATAFPSIYNDTLWEEETTHSLEKRANPVNDCNGVWLRATSGAKGVPVKYGDCHTALKINGFGGAFFHGKTGGVVTGPATLATTVLPADGEVARRTPPATGAAGDFGCDHLVELQILKTVLNKPGGVCSLAKAMTNKKDALNKIIAIRNIINSGNNLAFIQKTIEEPKTKGSVRFAQSGLTTVGVTKTHGTDLEFLATIDYLTKTSSKSLKVAADLDAMITRQFPGAPTGVLAAWTLYLAEMKAIGVTVELHARAEIKALKQQAQHNGVDPCSPAGSRPGTPPPSSPEGSRPGSPAHSSSGHTRRMVPLIPSSSLTSSVAQTVPVVRRAGVRPPVRSAARSGKNAPSAPSCPAPGQKGKTVVPRSQVKMKPAPTTKPRMPVNKPSPKPKPKKVVPRPANRPRRAVAKPAPPRKRITPKKVPKKVPKPASRSKGKARPRRR